MIAYKMFREMKDGSLSPLFINKGLRLQPGVEYDSGCFPTKGFAVRKGWHCGLKPNFPHLKLDAKGTKRVIRKVRIWDYEVKKVPQNQGGNWVLAEKMMILE